MHDLDDPLTIYVREATNVQPLSKDEEAKLFRELGGGSNWDKRKENIARRLIESHLMLVVNIAQKHSTADVPIVDLIEAGNIGLMNAIRSFAEKPIGDFNVYVAACIEQAIVNVLEKSK